MNILAIECATETASVALRTASGRIERRSAGEKQSAFLLPAIDALLAEAGLARGAIDAIAASRGPGGFTGVRFGIAVAQGLAFGLDRPVVPVSTLAALALQATRDAAATAGTTVLALLDARMDEVYGGSFRVNDDGGIEPTSDEFVTGPANTSVTAAGPLLVAGSGLAAYRMQVAVALGARPFAAAADSVPTAAAVADLAVRALSAGRGGAVETLRPVYLRDKVALTEAERARPPAGTPH